MEGKKTAIQTDPTREQYETLIGLLEEKSELQEKTIAVLEQQVEILKDILKIRSF